MKVLFRAETIRQDYKEETEGLKLINEVWYAIGNLVEIGNHNVILPAKQKVEIYGVDAMVDIHYEIKSETKAIHFEDMLDSEDNPIFASLDSKTGKGGDRLFGELYKVPRVVIIENGDTIIKGRDSLRKILSIAKLSVIGVQK